ncbi:hypothetical protein [Actinomadura formosensis]|uniref:hypothetical protein n=1 Tax=Actinomadura formosensis TaxID=60706 RepID=UPI003D8C3A1F
MRFLAMLALAAIATPIESWALMLAVGVVHGEWLPMMPTLGFFGALRINLAVSLLALVLGVAWAVGRAIEED